MRSEAKEKMAMYLGVGINARLCYAGHSMKWNYVSFIVIDANTGRLINVVYYDDWCGTKSPL